jgi:hypothetical protein
MYRHSGRIDKILPPETVREYRGGISTNFMRSSFREFFPSADNTKDDVWAPDRIVAVVKGPHYGRESLQPILPSPTDAERLVRRLPGESKTGG